jgi:hypothetical protein
MNRDGQTKKEPLFTLHSFSAFQPLLNFATMSHVSCSSSPTPRGSSSSEAADASSSSSTLTSDRRTKRINLDRWKRKNKMLMEDADKDEVVLVKEVTGGNAKRKGTGGKEKKSDDDQKMERI